MLETFPSTIMFAMMNDIEALLCATVVMTFIFYFSSAIFIPPLLFSLHCYENYNPSPSFVIFSYNLWKSPTITIHE